MDARQVVIHCSYSSEGKDIREIIKESFEIFLKKEILGMDIRQVGVVL